MLTRTIRSVQMPDSRTPDSSRTRDPVPIARSARRRPARRRERRPM